MNPEPTDLGLLRDRILYQTIAPAALLLMSIAAPIALVLLTGPNPSSGLVRLALLLFVLVALLDIVVAWGFYHLFERAQRPLAHLAMLLRVVYAVLLVASLSGYAGFSSQPGAGNSLSECYAQFDFGWTFALVIFGVHLVLLGIVILRSRYYHVLLGALVIVSGLGYILDSVAKILSGDSVLSISNVTFLGEVLLIGWLPINSFRLRKTMPAKDSEV